MGHSVEGRVPFLDHHLTEYVNGLPVSMKIRAATQQQRKVKDGTRDGEGSRDEVADREEEEEEITEKYVLREAVRPFVTEEIYKRRKYPYNAPAKYTVDGPLHQLMKRLVTKENVSRVGFLSWTCEGLEVAKGRRNLGELVDAAFEGGDEGAFRLTICIAQWVVLTERFGIVSHGLEEGGGGQDR